MKVLTVLDTAVFINHFRGLAAATASIQSLPVVQRATTDVTVVELYKGAAQGLVRDPTPEERRLAAEWDTLSAEEKQAHIHFMHSLVLTP